MGHLEGSYTDTSFTTLSFTKDTAAGGAGGSGRTLDKPRTMDKG